MEKQDYKEVLNPLIWLLEDNIRKIVREEVFRALEEYHNAVKPKHLYSREEVCVLLDISKPTLWNITKEGFIKSTKIGRRVLYSEEAIKEYLEKGKVMHKAYEIESKKDISLLNKKTYIMFDESTKMYKIGISENPRFREGTLRSEKPSVKLMYICDFNIEKFLHTKYKEYRVRGEWFNLTKDQIKEIVHLYQFKDYSGDKC